MNFQELCVLYSELISTYKKLSSLTFWFLITTLIIILTTVLTAFLTVNRILVSILIVITE